MNREAGKGSKPRPYSISQEEYDKRWDAIFGRDLTVDNTDTEKNTYQDILSTEDCLLEGFEKRKKGD
jgi:hypothetical protein